MEKQVKKVSVIKLNELRKNELARRQMNTFSKKIFLTAGNKLLPCERINHKYAMGAVSKNVVIDIPGIAQQFSFYYEHLKNVCQYCYAYRIRI